MSFLKIPSETDVDRIKKKNAWVNEKYPCDGKCTELLHIINIAQYYQGLISEVW